jgi:hypothetical protein
MKHEVLRSTGELRLRPNQSWCERVLNAVPQTTLVVRVESPREVQRPAVPFPGVEALRPPTGLTEGREATGVAHLRNGVVKAARDICDVNVLESFDGERNEQTLAFAVYVRKLVP